jgi:hypothetical protein
MTIFGSGHEVVTSTTRPASPLVGQVIYQTDTDEYLKYVSYGGTNRWMQADVKPQRNFIINGGLDVWQRGTNFNPTSASVLTGVNYGADRWQMAQATSHANAFSRATVNGNLAYWGTSTFARMWRTNLSTATTPFIMQQSIESISVINANRQLPLASKKYLTLGFWCRTFKGSGGTANPFVTAEIITGTGTDSVIGSFTGQTTRATVTTAHAQTDSNFTYYTVSFEVTTVFTQLGVRFTYAPTGTAGDFDVVEISGVQLENGSAPSHFEVEGFEDVLLKCQRYYAASLSGSDFFANNYFWGAGPNSLYNFGIGVAFPRSMRIVPTLSVNFINFDNSTNAGQTVHASGFTQYYRNANGSFPYCGWRATYSASAEL